MDGVLQTWYERIPKEGVLCWWEGPVLVAEQNLEGHGAESASLFVE